MEKGFIGAGKEIRTPDQRLGNTGKGIAQTLVTTGIPSFQLIYSQIDSLPGFGSLCCSPTLFVCISNTYLTPTNLARNERGGADGRVAV